MFTDESLNETPIMSQMTGGTHGDTFKDFTYHGFTYQNKYLGLEKNYLTIIIVNLMN